MRGETGKDEKMAMMVVDEDCGGNTSVTRQGGRRIVTCDRGGSELLKKNMARHRRACGAEVTRKCVNVVGEI